MCGIAGIFNYDSSEVKRGDVEVILSRMAHRGRDAAGIMLDGIGKPSAPGLALKNVGFGHCRLSIIDITSGGNQPMTADDGHYAITYNGEVYNYLELRSELRDQGYVFKSNTDTEVILYAYIHWGRNCLQKFNGMFAFAILDKRRNEIFCARDPLGIKPFVYFRDERQFVFASENRALMHLVNRSLDTDAIAAYLLTMYVPTPWSIFKGLRKLAAGHMLIIDGSGRTQEEAYWNIGATAFNNSPEKREEILSLLKDSVYLQMRSDVPVGACLSGGMDSSTIVALLSEHASTLHTFSVGYRGHDIDERPFARLIANRYGTIHHELELSPNDLLSSFYEAASSYDEPIADSAFIPTFMISRLAASEGIKVLLNGTGGDEIFGGYTRYFQLSLLRRILDLCPVYLRKMLGGFFSHFGNSLSVRLEHPEIDQAISTGGCVDLARACLGTDEEFLRLAGRLSQIWNGYMPEDLPRLYKKMHFDLKTYLLDDLLMLLDSMTMASTVEGRVPFLDARIVEAAFSFSPESHVRGADYKCVLRSIAADILPEQILNRTKMGFGGPVPLWVQENFGEITSHAERTLRNIIGSSYRNSPLVRNLLSDHTDISLVALFRLAVFGIWHETTREMK